MATVKFRMGLALFLVALLCVPARSAVLSIDLGSEWLKVSVINPKKGQSPITIAINEMSKRKTPALVAFQSGDRMVGEEAAGLVARYPDKVFSQVRDLIGKPYEYAKRVLDASYLPFDMIVQEWQDNKSWLPKDRIDEVVKRGEELKVWLEEKETEQKNSGFAKSAFTSNDVYDKLFNLQAKISSVDMIPKPKPRVEKPAKTESEKKEESPSSSPSEEESSSNDQSADDAERTSDKKIEQENEAESDSESHDEL